MRDKEQLNLNQIKTLVETSSLRKFFTLGVKVAQGGGGGVGASALILAIVTITGITAAFAIEIIAAVTGAVIFAGLAFGISYYNLWKEEQKLKGLKESLDEKVLSLNNSLLEAIKNYQFLEESKAKIKLEISRLQSLLGEIIDEGELAQIKHTITDLEHDVVDLDNVKTELVERVKVALSVISGDGSNSEKLYSLFGQVTAKKGADAVDGFAIIDPRNNQHDITTVRSGLNALTKALDEPSSPLSKKDHYSRELEQLIQPQKPKTHTAVKRLMTVLAGLGGLLGGAGTVVTVSALVLGGMAAVTGVGLPIAAIALGVGLLSAGIAIFCQKRIERRQQKILNKMNVATAQVSGMTHYVDDRINKTATTKIKEVDRKYQAACNDINVRLNEHRKSFTSYKEQTAMHTSKIRSLISEVNKFHVFLPSQLETVKKLREEIKADIILLSALKSHVSKVAIVAGSEREKTALIGEIDALIKEAKQDDADSLIIHNKIDAKLHENHSVHVIKDDNNLLKTRPTQLPANTPNVEKVLENLELREEVNPHIAE